MKPLVPLIACALIQSQLVMASNNQKRHQPFSLSSYSDRQLSALKGFLTTAATLQTIASVICFTTAPCTPSPLGACACGAKLLCGAFFCAGCEACIQEEIETRGFQE